MFIYIYISFFYIYTYIHSAEAAANAAYFSHCCPTQTRGSSRVESRPVCSETPADEPPACVLRALPDEK